MIAPTVGRALQPGSPTFIDQLAAICMLTTEPHSLLTADQAQYVIDESYRQRKEPIQVLLDAPDIRVPAIDLLAAIAIELGLKTYDFHSRRQWLHEDLKLLQRFDLSVLRQLKALPMIDADKRAYVVCADPMNTQIRNYILTRLGPHQGLVLAPATQIQARLSELESSARANQLQDEISNQVSGDMNPNRREGAAGVVRESRIRDWMLEMVKRAVSTGVSDIHLEKVAGGDLWIRFRKDGILHQQPHSLSPEQGDQAVAALLGLCGESIKVERYREPQDGTFSLDDVAGRRVDARVSVLPQLYGRKTVVRLLDSNNMKVRLDDMGFKTEHLDVLRDATNLPQGMVIISGPTGSGKTTTLYGLLREVDAVSKNVMTAEDPVEYRLPFISQTPVTRADNNPRAVTFARALRAFMRQDPDVILVGEVRDIETAGVAADAAVTGHLVLTTVHANDALGILTRFRELEVPPSILADAVSVLIAQRLLRKVHECAKEEPPTAEETQILGELGLTIPDTVRHAVGCAACQFTGYLGRFAVVELVQPDTGMRKLIRANADLDVLTDHALTIGYVPMMYTAHEAVIAGKTTVQDLLRVMRRDLS